MVNVREPLAASTAKAECNWQLSNFSKKVARNYTHDMTGGNASLVFQPLEYLVKLDEREGRPCNNNTRITHQRGCWICKDSRKRIDTWQGSDPAGRPTDVGELVVEDDVVDPIEEHIVYRRSVNSIIMGTHRDSQDATSAERLYPSFANGIQLWPETGYFIAELRAGEGLKTACPKQTLEAE